MSLRANNTVITGYAARLPGAGTVDAFWTLLDDGLCSVSEIRPDRFDTRGFHHPRPGTSGRSFTFAAGQIDDVWGFDAGFFGISPREAVQIDPQQRLLLQVVWEAIENAGLRPSDLAGTQTGVYVGASGLDYHQRLLFDLPSVDVQTMTGNTLSIISNRVSYIFDLRGPSFTLDTACSSSLVALHQAVSAIESGQIDTAIVAGVNLLLSPFSFIGFARASMLSPQGLCRAFDASGDGYVRSEGAVAMVLQRDTTAREPRARILATGINADGRTAGLSLPSSPAQKTLLESIYSDELGISPDDLAFVEAHGTGTQVGDPAEANALGTAIGRKRGAPLPIGSVKTNVGHLEPVSGLVGILKSVLALHHDRLPKSLHFDEPNPNIDFAGLNLAVAAEPVELARGTRPRLAGINSFGFGGTNAHAVIGDMEPAQPCDSRVAHTAPLVISARSQGALRALAGRYAALVEDHAETASAVIDAAARRRDLHDHRLVVLGDSAAKISALQAFAEGKEAPAAVEGKTAPRTRGVAFAFSGNGSQWAGMGQDAYSGDKVFREALELVDRHFMAVSGWSLVTMLFSKDLETEIERTEIAQPLLFAVQAALVTALKARGIAPAAVLGHSVGEVAAAWCAGMLDLATATRIIHARSTQQEVVRHLGSMAALLLPAEDARAAIAEAGLPGIELSAINSPRSVTISGPSESIDAFARLARKKRWALRKLNIAYPFHSALVDPIETPLREALGTLTCSKPAIPFLSSVTPEQDEVTPDATYWWENVRRPVRFTDAVARLAEQPIDLVVEIGPKAVLTTYVRDTLRSVGNQTQVLASQEMPRSEGAKAADIDTIAARIVAHGATPDLDLYVGPEGRNLPVLPDYPWQLAPFLTPETEERITAHGERGWPLAGKRLRPETAEWFNLIDLDLLPFLADHKVEQTAVFPAAGYIEMALRAALQWTGETRIEVRDLEILRPLVLDEGKTFETMVRLSPDDRVIEIHARPRLSGADWSLYAKAGFRTLAGSGTALPAAADVAGTQVSHDEIYRLTLAHGLDYGPAFRLADTAVLSGEREARLALLAPAALPEPDSFALHPAVADAGFHGLFALLGQRAEPAEGGFLPIRFSGIELHAPASVPVAVRIRVDKGSARSLVASFDYLDAEGGLVARLTGARFKAVQFHMAERDHGLTYRVVSRLLTPADAGASQALPLAVIADGLGLVASEEYDPSDAGLLADALARTVAHRALHAVLGSAPFTLAAKVRDGSLHESAAPFAAHFLDLLAHHELATEDDGQWRIFDPAEGLDPASLVQTLVFEAGAHGSQATLLARLADDLPDLLRQGLPASAGDVFASALLAGWRNADPAAQALRRACLDIAGRAVADWPQDKPLSVLVLGERSLAVARHLDTLLSPYNATLTVGDPVPGAAERLRRNWHGSAQTRFLSPEDGALAEGGPYDLAVCCDTLSGAGDAMLKDLAAMLSPGGQLLALERAPSSDAELILGTGADWWLPVPGSSRPATPLLGGEGWAARLAAFGLAEVEALPLAGGEVDASILIARAPTRSVSAANGNGAAESGTELRRMAIVCDADGPSRAVASALRECLKPHRIEAVLITSDGAAADDGVIAADLDDPAAWGEETPLAAAARDGIIHLAGAYARAGSGSGEDASALLSARTWQLAQMLKGRGSAAGPVVVIAPEGARAPACGTAPDPVQAGVWAFGRVAMNEFPSAGLRLVDIRRDLDASAAALRLAAEIVGADLSDERELVIDGDTRLGLRLERGPELPQPGSSDTDADILRLDIAQQGSLDRLAWSRVPARALVGDEVEIAVEASGLNFRDVMWALGLLPEEALEDGFAGPTLGMECAGTVVATGPKARRLRPGDKVIAFAPACFASRVTVSEKGCARTPQGLEPEAAATIPVAFLTSYYALHRLARLEAHETVLIHGGAGGVGLAAIQVARHIGATIIATAGSPEKRSLLRRLGVDHVLDSRSLTFADDVMRLTGGKGIEVVLNSLSGEAMERSIEVLAPFGRFLELGKRDYYENTHLGLRPFRRNLSYFGIDADQLLIHQPALAERLLDELMQLFAGGALSPLPYRAFEADEAVAAFRLMQQAGHIGKIVIRPPQQPATAAALAAPAPFRFEGEAGSLVVVGGFGGFGAALIARLADMGATRIDVLSRRGATTPEAVALIEEMGRRGVTVVGHACDATSEKAVAAALAAIRKDAGAIQAAFHTAMVLHDTLLSNLTREQLDAVLAPKVRGAQLLDALTRGDALRQFVLFSSATTLVGNPGQANYVAANGYLEGLAARRRTEGLPGLAVAWGAISDAGYLARNADVGDLLARKLGRHALTAREALDGLATLMALPQDDAVAAAPGYARIDWAAARRDLALLATPFAERLGIAAGNDGAGEGGAIDLAALVKGLDRASAIAKICKLLAVEIGRILRIGEDDIDPARPLTEVGMDSLMALELRMAAERQFGIDIPLMSLANGATLSDMATRIADQALSGGTANGADLSSEARTNAMQHLGEDVFDGDAEALAEVAAEVEERTRNVRSLL
ncbi:type I polyketide synthase [Stappia indica]|uniref:type I polyketide synthase n=1 Tax=Stappia indica TaxID=538381 RepID=UPI0018EF2188|nr:type I polyketide synthase [Stappia indica]